MSPFHLQSNVRESRENRERLRHCNGLQVPIATGLMLGKAGMRLETRKSGYRFDCARLSSVFAELTSPSKRRMRPVPKNFSLRNR